MTKATQMAKVSAKGGFHMLWGLVLSTVISSVGTIIIAWVLGASEYALYGIALIVPNLLSTVRDLGINTAMIRYSAQYNSENDMLNIKRVFITGILLELILGILLSVLAFLLSGFLAGAFHRPTMVPLIQIASFMILTGALVSASSAAFTGMETMHLNSVVLVIQSLVKTAFVVGLVVLGLGTFGAITGFTIATLVAGFSGIILMWVMYRSLPRAASGRLEILSTAKMLFKYGLPTSVGTIIGGFLAPFYSYLMAIYVTNNSTIGNYNLALTFSVLIAFFATPVTTMMFPAFSKLDNKKDRDTLQNVFQYSVKYASFIVVPVTLLVMALAQPGISAIFQNKYSEAPLYLVLTSVSFLYVVFGNLSIGSLINGQGYTTFNMKLYLLTAVVGLPLSFLLISNFGVYGLIVTSLVAGLPSAFIGLRFIQKKFGVSVDWLSSAKILFSSVIAGLLTYLFVSGLMFSSAMLLIIGVVVFAVFFLLAALLSGTIKKADVANMREVVNSLGPLKIPLNLMLNLIDKLISTFRGQ
jgi:O-antigen/teichoic acid export membrane protein